MQSPADLEQQTILLHERDVRASRRLMRIDSQSQETLRSGKVVFFISI